MKKNIMLISVDQWAGNYLGCAGEEQIITPTIDDLASCGIRYTNAISSTPVCIPARRELMLGVDAATHGDRTFNENLCMPSDLPTIAETFKKNGYQTYAVGKLHVFPQRDRIGFDDVLLNEEGRHLPGMSMDDYERFVADSGYYGMENTHCMTNNNYYYNGYNLPENLHQTNWTARKMCEFILRKDPTRPAFWYASFAAPHPPLVPPRSYYDLYDGVELSEPRIADWAESQDAPTAFKFYRSLYKGIRTRKFAKRAYFATCTQIDYQIRLIIGTLREQKLLDETIIVFVSDHGEMLGTNNLYGKFLMYENSVKVPLIISLPEGMGYEQGITDDRLVELRDIYPTLLSLVGIDIPASVNGISLLGKEKRDYTYGQLWEDERATRMIRTNKYKLIYYPCGNMFQMFDILNDPDEQRNIFSDPKYSEERTELLEAMKNEVSVSDPSFLESGVFVGSKTSGKQKGFNFLRGLHLQRGIR